MADRYFYPEIGKSARIELGPEGAHHLVKVLRKHEGAEIQLFDGQGREARCLIAKADPRACLLEVQELLEFTERRLRRVELAFSPPKGGRAETLLQMGTELGCHTFHPLQCQRTPPECRGNPKRWARVLQAAAGQSGARWLPHISPPQPLASFLEDPFQSFSGERWLTTPGPDPSPSSTPPLDLPPALVLVGPEGDFTPQEKDRILSVGAHILPLGPHILRIETACTTALTRLLHAPPAW